MSSVTIASLSAQLERLSEGLEELHERIVETYEDVRALIAIMLRSERYAEAILAETKKGAAQLREFNKQYESWA